VATNDLTATMVITGGDFLRPVKVLLVGTTTYTLPAHLVSSAMITIAIPPGLPAQEYAMKVVNGDQGDTSLPGSLGLFKPENACFYDRFGSGANKWQRSGDWGLVTIVPSRERAMTDSPTTNYNNADHYGSGLITHTTAITSQAFSLAGCPNPVLTFDHDYVIAKLKGGQDVGRVEISTDDGLAWTELISYTGGSVFGSGAQDVESPEWANLVDENDWKSVDIDLSAYTGTVRLRFSLEVNDDAVSSKGWILDNVVVKSGSGSGTGSGDVFLPIILKEN
jgi:hypothetical protein